MKRFWRAFRMDLLRAFSLKFVVAFAAIPLLMALDNSVDLLYMFSPEMEMSVHYYYFQSICFGGLFSSYLLAMACALPYAASFLDEYQMDFAPWAIVRSGKWPYFLSKFLANALVGGAVNALGQGLFMALISINVPLFRAGDLEFLDGFFYGNLALHYPPLYFAVALYYAFLMGALYAGVAIFSSCVVKNRYSVFVMPAIALFAERQISNLLRIPEHFRIYRWLTMRAVIVDEQTTSLLSLALVIVILGICGYVFMRRGRRLNGCA